MPAVMRDRPKASKGKGKGAGSTKAAPRAALPYAPKIGTPEVGLQPRLALIAAGAVLVGAAGIAMATGGRAHALGARMQGAVADRFAAAGFRVANIEVEGASRFSVPYIVRAAQTPVGTPLVGLDLDQVRRRVEQVGWVKSVRILRLLPDTLVFAVSERPRLAVWQDGGKARVVDPDGDVIPEADPGLFVDLPLIVGAGAPQAANAILPLLASRPRLMSKVEAAVRVDQRRWDVRLKDGGLIQLPAVDEDGALIQLDQLDQKDRLLDLGFERIDLRDPEMIVVRPRQPGGASPATAPGAQPFVAGDPALGQPAAQAAAAQAEAALQAARTAKAAAAPARPADLAKT